MGESEQPKSQPLASANLPQRLGLNTQGYFGKTIDITTVLADCAREAAESGWNKEEIPAGEGLSLMAFKRAPEENPQPKSGLRSRRIYVSAGIHGDEPAGPLAVCQLLRDRAFPAELDVSIFPCLNPSGFLLNRRENADGLDLNRQYLEPVAREIKAHIAWLERQAPFDLCLCLHEDWEAHGFYIYELNPDARPSMAPAIVERVSAVCPIDPSELIEGREAHNGIIRPNVDPASRPQWPEAFFLLTRKTRLSYTLEAPSDYPLATRVAALCVGVKTALELLGS